jgi:hypothetical protein
MNTSNLKDKVTTICGLVLVIGGSLLAVELPPNVKNAIGVAMAVAGGLIGYFTGKSPSGVIKTDNQANDQNKPNP